MGLAGNDSQHDPRQRDSRVNKAELYIDRAKDRKSILSAVSLLPLPRTLADHVIFRL